MDKVTILKPIMPSIYVRIMELIKEDEIVKAGEVQ